MFRPVYQSFGFRVGGGARERMIRHSHLGPCIVSLRVQGPNNHILSQIVIIGSFEHLGVQRHVTTSELSSCAVAVGSVSFCPTGPVRHLRERPPAEQVGFRV